MDNLNLLCQTIRFQRAALQNSLAMISAVQQHGEKLLKTSLEQSPWIPGESRDACLFWAGLWTKNLTGMTGLVDRNLATMERLTSIGDKEPGQRKPAEKPATKPTEQPQSMEHAAKPTEQPQPMEPAAKPTEQPQPIEHAAKPTEQPQPMEPAAKPTEQPQMEAAREAAPEKKHREEPQPAEKEMEAPEEAEQTALVKTEPQRALVQDQPPVIKPSRPQGKPSEKRKSSEPKT